MRQSENIDNQKLRCAGSIPVLRHQYTGGIK
jgi:hypothetical protein